MNETNETNEAVENEATEVETQVETVKIPRNRVERDDFIEAWEEVALGDSPSVENVAARLGLQATSCQQRAMKYRRENGIPLTKMPRNSSGASFNTEAALSKLEEVRARIKAKQAETAADSSDDESVDLLGAE